MSAPSPLRPEAMMTATSECPDMLTLQRFLLGQGSADESTALEAHFESCQRCVAAFSTLDTEDSLVSALQRRSAAAEENVQEADGLLAAWLKKLRPTTVGHSTPPADKAKSDSATVTHTPAEPGGDDNTLSYEFLTPGQNPQELGRLGHYHVRKVIGSGGMGVVFLAFDPDLQRQVALKTTLPALAANPSAKQRFLREARAAAALKHDHIVTIYHVGEDHGMPYLAMEFLDGESLDRRLQCEGKLPFMEALRITREAAEGLAAAHRQGLIHRDIKPGNIWLETTSEPHTSLGPSWTRVKILDFGLAVSATNDSHLTQSGAVVGTPAFMAPEQCRGQTVDARSDLFSLGCVLYRMTTGAAPFRGNHAISTLIAIATTNPRPPGDLNPALPTPVCNLILRLLAKAPADRPSSAQELVDTIRAIEQDRPLPARPVARPPQRRSWALAAGALACLLAVIGYSFWPPAPSGISHNGFITVTPDDDSLKAVSGPGKGPRQFFDDPAHALSGVLDHRDIAGADADAFRKWQASLGVDFRLASITTRQGAGPILYNAVAVRENVPRLVRFRAEVLQDANGIKQIWDDMKLDGFRLHSCTAQPNADDQSAWTQSFLWVQEPSITGWFVRPGEINSVMQDIQANRAHGCRPWHFNAQKDQAVLVPFEAKIQDRLWEAEASLTADELLTAVKSNKKRGWRPDVLAPYFDHGRLRFVLVCVGNDDGPDWRFRMDMTLEQYQQESSRQREQGLFPLSIVSWGNEAEVRYAAIWVRCREPGASVAEPEAPSAKLLADRAVKAVSWASAGKQEIYIDGAHALGEILDFRELIAATSAELQAWHEKLEPKLRIVKVTSRTGAGEALFNAVAVQDKEPLPTRFNVQITGEMADKAWDENGKEENKYRLLANCANLSPEQTPPWENTQIWVKDGNTQVFWHGFLSDVVEWTKDKKATPSKFRPVWVDARTILPEGGVGANVSTGPAQGRAWELLATLTSDELLAAVEFYRHKGWRPDIVHPYVLKDGQVRTVLVAVDNSDQVDWRFRMDMSRAEYEKESAAQKKLGLFPLDLHSYGHQADIRYAAIWARYRVN